jgi:hypothetical protein
MQEARSQAGFFGNAASNEAKPGKNARLKKDHPYRHR